MYSVLKKWLYKINKMTFCDAKCIFFFYAQANENALTKKFIH